MFNKSERISPEMLNGFAPEYVVPFFYNMPQDYFVIKMVNNPKEPVPAYAVYEEFLAVSCPHVDSLS